MIRIDLLASPQDRTGNRKAPWLAGVEAVAGLATIVAALVTIMWWAWTLQGEREEVSQALTSAEATLRTMAPAVDRMREAEELRADLLGFVGRVEALDGRRRSALRMLNGLSTVLPDDVWFSAVRWEGDGVFVDGHATTLAAVSEYVTALEAADALGAPVEVVDSQRGEWSGREIFNFELRVSLPAVGDGS